MNLSWLTDAACADYHASPMAIQFLCGSCRQPIEVDDAWASRAILCPFCRTTVTAPATSTLTDLTQIPTASPLVSTPRVEAVGSTKLNRRNPVAVAALILACMIVPLFFVAGILAQSHELELKDFAERLQNAPSESKSPTQVMMEFINARGGVMPGWLLAMAFIEVIAGLCFLAAMVCGVIGLFRPGRRWPAVAALVVCLGPVIWLGLSFFAGFGLVSAIP